MSTGARVPGDTTGAERRPAATRFLALANPDCRRYLVGGMLSMMGDNVEHVITYWMLYQYFHSPALAGFAVISHWVPFLLLSVFFGSLADRYDCRKVIQASQLLFMSVSASWGALFLTQRLEVWHAMVLLSLHGMAAALWAPAEQLMLHDIVGPETLPSAVRLNSTARSLGILCGPAVGSALLLGLGPTFGIFANVLIYLPLTTWLLTVPYTGHLREQPGARRPRLSLVAAVRVLRDVADNPTIIAMVALGGVSALLIGAALGPQMPEFAHDLGIDTAGLAYGGFIAANAGGAVLGGILLEASGLLRPSARTALFSTVVWGLSMIGFAATESYPLSILLLILAGVASLASQSIAQTLVQLLAPPAERGRVIGLYSMASNGLKAGSGVTVGILGGFISIRWSLGLSALLLCFVVLGLLVLVTRAAAGEASARGAAARGR
ncbi:MAG TPA: MFS transporter [Chloroflexota bacterium]|nr:MFS transporter [Chloroflexota bacterium]